MSATTIGPRRCRPFVCSWSRPGVHHRAVLSGGRLALGVGVGYNPIEFEALGADFKTRGKRLEEQIEVLRRLWTEAVVTFEGEFHVIRDAGLAPLPLQKPIPLWFGLGRTIAPIPPEPVLRRVGRLADGWLPLFDMTDEASRAIEIVHDSAREAGRDPAALPMEMRLMVEDKTPQALTDEIRRLEDFGAQKRNVHFAANSPAEHIDDAKRFRQVMDRFQGFGRRLFSLEMATDSP